jgi:antirestriction protein ArdC
METKTSTSEMIGMIEQGVKDVLTSERFTEFLKFSAQFHHYSLNNVILILIQKPDASYVAGYNAWQKMNRQVNKGEHGIRILAPCTGKKTVTDEDGNDTVIATQYFRPVSVFDISQTSGEDIPTICDELFGDIENADELTQKISSATDYSISYEDTGEAFGRCNNDEKTIKVRDDLDDRQRIKTLIHEVAHSLLWNADKEQHNSRSDQEIEAEATAYIVCSKLGIDTASYSFDYIASWSADKDVKALKRLLGNIQKASQKIIDKLSA